jgi:hypothetical protein
MANKRISSLDDITLVGGTSTPGLTASDIIPVTDVDDTTGSLQGTTKKVTVANLVAVAPVQSVNTATGAVVLDADDIDDTSTTHKFVTSSDITNLGNLSGTNTGDQDLSSYQLQPAEGAFVDGDKTKLDSALQSLSAGALSDFDFDDNAIFGFGASVNTPTITANAYTLTDADNGKVLALDNGTTAMTVNVNTGLVSGFNCSFIQAGSGQVTFAGTATLNNRQSHTKINDQYGVASIVAYATDTYILAGDTAA